MTLLLLLGATTSHAAERLAPSCSRDDVGATVAAASPGDVVLIPAGTCSWTVGLAVDKPLTLRGAGQTATVLRDGVPKDSPTQANLILVDDAPGFRLTELTIEGQAQDPDVYNRGHVLIAGATSGFRVDHVTFKDTVTVGVRSVGRSTGLVDHCTFDYDFHGGVDVWHDRWDGGSWGDTSWATPSNFGSDDLVVIEDCSFINRASGAGGFVGVQAGGRAVVRHNHVRADTFFLSGTDSAGRFRGGRHFEVYANTLETDAPSLWTAIAVEGGTGVIFDNVVDSRFSSAVNLEVRRTVNAPAVWGRCNGSSPLDQNSQPNGYACLDMVGRGQGALLRGDTPMPAVWPQQSLEPVYIWNNTFDGGALIRNGAPDFVAAGREYLVGMPKPGYVPFQYPHPLAVEPDAGVVDGGLGSIRPEPEGQVRWLILGCGCSSSPGLLLWLGPLALVTRRRRSDAGPSTRGESCSSSPRPVGRSQ